MVLFSLFPSNYAIVTINSHGLSLSQAVVFLYNESMPRLKYYLKQPRGAIVRDILFWVEAGGVAVAAIAAPNAVGVFAREFVRRHPARRNNSAVTAFRRLLREGSLELNKEGRQIYASLTKEGKKRAGRFQIDSLEIQKPKRWDKKWRIVIFDIPHENRLVREALRGFLKRLGFCQVQKSVWAYPYDCRDEIKLIRDFFGVPPSQLCLIVAAEIEQAYELRKRFKL